MVQVAGTPTFPDVPLPPPPLPLWEPSPGRPSNRPLPEGELKMGEGRGNHPSPLRQLFFFALPPCLLFRVFVLPSPGPLVKPFSASGVTHPPAVHLPNLRECTFRVRDVSVFKKK
eukprot:RCo025261